MCFVEKKMPHATYNILKFICQMWNHSSLSTNCHNNLFSKVTESIVYMHVSLLRAACCSVTVRQCPSKAFAQLYTICITKPSPTVHPASQAFNLNIPRPTLRLQVFLSLPPTLLSGLRGNMGWTLCVWQMFSDTHLCLCSLSKRVCVCVWGCVFKPSGQFKWECWY